MASNWDMLEKPSLQRNDTLKYDSVAEALGGPGDIQVFASGAWPEGH